MADNEGSGVMPRALVGALVALAGVMLIPDCIPVIDDVTMSVAVIDCVPAVFSVAEKVCVPVSPPAKA